ncbi:hypothetical protein ACIOFV_15180 [Streptomyces mirabilis]
MFDGEPVGEGLRGCSAAVFPTASSGTSQRAASRLGIPGGG